MSNNTFFVVSDSSGFIVAYDDKEKLLDFHKKYTSVRFITSAHNFIEGAQKNYVYILPYRDIDAVAYASNCIESCRNMQKMLMSVNLTYDDDVEFWEQPFNIINKRIMDRISEDGEERSEEEKLKLKNDLDEILNQKLHILESHEKENIYVNVFENNIVYYASNVKEEVVKEVVTEEVVTEEVVSEEGVTEEVVTEEVVTEEVVSEEGVTEEAATEEAVTDEGFVKCEAEGISGN